jgi:hypothetical protein
MAWLRTGPALMKPSSPVDPAPRHRRTRFEAAGWLAGGRADSHSPPPTEDEDGEVSMECELVSLSEGAGSVSAELAARRQIEQLASALKVWDIRHSRALRLPGAAVPAAG